MKTKQIVRLAVAALVLVVFAGCMWDPPRESGAGSITLDFSAFAGAELSGSALAVSDVNAARVWLFNGRVSYILDPANNRPFVQVSLASAANANVTIDGIPEDAGYRIQVVLGQSGTTAGNAWFKPILFDSSNAFQVAGGRETPVTVVPRSPTALAGISDIQYAREGRNVVGAVGGLTIAGGPALAVSDSASTGTTAAGTAAVYLSGATLAPLNETISLASGAAVNAVTVGPWGAKDTLQLFLSTNRGIVAPGRDVSTQPAAARNGVTSVGSFVVTEENAPAVTVVFYQRPGGLGGAGFEGNTPVAADWEDIPLDDVVGDQDPVYSQASDIESARAVFATRIGSFIFTDKLFNSTEEVDFVSVLMGQGSAEGLTFFGIDLPGSGSRLQVQHVAFVNSGNGVVIGTPRGAFYAPFSSIENGTQTGVTTLSDVFDQPVQQLAVNSGGTRVAILTNRVLAIYTVSGTGQMTLSASIPSVAVAMGTPRSISFAGGNQILISGTEGLVRITAQ